MVRHVKRGFDKAGQTSAMQALAETRQLQFGIAATIFATNLADAQNILGGHAPDSTSCSTCCASPTRC
jgi:hypothetical protein